MMNKLTKKLAIALAVGTMTIAATGAIAHASEIQEIETVDVSVDDCISKIFTAPPEGSGTPGIDLWEIITNLFS